MAKKTNDAHHEISWRRRPSEIRGYKKTLYATLDNNDYVRVDYNIKEKIVRLYAEVNEEGGNSYYSIIKDGKITSEKSVASGRTASAPDKFKDRADYFSTIPSREIINLINKNYGIDFPGSKASLSEKTKRFNEIRKRYFKPDEYAPGSRKGGSGISLTEIRFTDIIDMAVGLSLSGAAFYLFNYDYIAMGIVASFYGIIIGLVDMLIRSRSPFFLKMVIFIFGGAAAYMYGYFSPGKLL